MEGLFYNANHGYVALSTGSVLQLIATSFLEGIVRGYRNNLLTSANYNTLTQCETIDGTLLNSP